MVWSNERKLTVLLLFMVLLIVLANKSFAESSSPGFIITADVFDSDGGESNSPDFALNDSLGQSIPVGDSASPNFGISAGAGATVLSAVVLAEINIDPDTLNMNAAAQDNKGKSKGNGQFITCYLELPEPYMQGPVEDVDAEVHILLDDAIEAVSDPKFGFVSNPQPHDADNDGIPEFMVKFYRDEVIAIIESPSATLTVSGFLKDGVEFVGSDTIKVLDGGKGGKPTAAPVLASNIPKKTVLKQSYPNPFNPETWIPYQLSEGADAAIRIYNVSGQLVRRLDLGYKDAGYYLAKEKAAYWNGRNESGEKVSSGIYFYLMEAGSFRAMKKMLVVR